MTNFQFITFVVLIAPSTLLAIVSLGFFVAQYISSRVLKKAAAQLRKATEHGQDVSQVSQKQRK